MSESDTEPGDTPELIAAEAMWYSGVLPDAGLAYVALYVLLQIILLPFRWLRRASSRGRDDSLR